MSLHRQFPPRHPALPCEKCTTIAGLLCVSGPKSAIEWVCGKIDRRRGRWRHDRAPGGPGATPENRASVDIAVPLLKPRRRATMHTAGLEKRLRPVVPLRGNRVGPFPGNRVVPFLGNQAGPITGNPALSIQYRPLSLLITVVAC